MTVHSIEDRRFIHQAYDHQRYEFRRRFLRFLIRYIGFTLLAKLDRVEGIENIPQTGAAILMINHIAFIDPIAVLHVVPRNIVPLAKIEVYSLPGIGIFPRIYGVVPVRREEVDRRAIQGALEILRAGEIILVAPEAHRSPQLQQGKEGIAYLATRANAPVIPVAVEDTPGYPTLRYSRRWFGEGIKIRFGKPFQFRIEDREGKKDLPGRETLHQMTDEAMYVLAGLLPERRRGVYHDLSKATQETLEFL